MQSHTAAALLSLTSILDCEPSCGVGSAQAADVVCVTCAGAGDPRLSAFRFRKVRCSSNMSCKFPVYLMP